MLVKTGMGLSRKITEFVKKEHSYECPCIMVMHPTDGNKDFLSGLQNYKGHGGNFRSSADLESTKDNGNVLFPVKKSC